MKRWVRNGIGVGVLAAAIVAIGAGPAQAGDDAGDVHASVGSVQAWVCDDVKVWVGGVHASISDPHAQHHPGLSGAPNSH
ncbi:hypothetical protein AB0M43_07240 [Longispora sp. NPDC051575]|uniref:hypothetical protein n=1 Tax=Longispora sp. NPDC051575 TaxID=3154943 RepID=UPI00342EEB78